MAQKKINKKTIKNTKLCQFFTYDIETYPSKKETHEPYLITLYSEQEVKFWFKEDPNHNIIREFIDHVSKNYHNHKGFAHNAGNFDARPILHELKVDEFLSKTRTCLVKEGNILAIYLKNNITLADSFHLLPRSLQELAEEFKLELSKGSIPHDKITLKNYKNYKEDAIVYCIKDSQILFNVLEHFQHVILANDISPIDPLNCITLPQFAFQTFRTDKYFPEKWKLFKLDKRKYNFVAEGYYGGKVDVFVTYAKSDNEGIFYYDVNSLYPHVMLNVMPEGEGVWVEGKDIDLSTFFGFLEVTVTVPDTLNIPILPFRHDGGLYFPKGTFTSIQFSEELRYAKELGYEIKNIRRGLSFDKRENVFYKYVNEFYKIKEQESKTRGALYFVVKLLLNALYGKFGMKPVESEFRVIDPRDLHTYIDFCTVENIVFLKDAILIRVKEEHTTDSLKTDDFIYRKETEGPEFFSWNRNERSPAHVSAAIASYSRIVLDKCIRALGEEYACYVDTDSVVSLIELPKEKINSSALGFWKEEGRYIEYYAFGPKIYRLIPKKGTKNKPVDKCAGIPNKEVKQALDTLKETHKYTSNQILKFKKDHRTMDIHTNVEYTKTITAYSTKKRKFYSNKLRTQPVVYPDDFTEL